MLKKIFCMMLVLLILDVPALAQEEASIDYPHFMYRMEVSDFGEDFTTLGKRYSSLPIIVPFRVAGAEDRYYLYKSETNEYVSFLADGYAGGGESCYETLANAVEAYFGADAAQFVRNNFDYTEFETGGKMEEEIGDYLFEYIAGNNHRGYSVTIKRKPIFSDLPEEDWRTREINHFFDLVGEGVIKGMGDGTFAPNANITRAQFAVMFARLIGVGEGNYKGYFPDVPDGQWYTSAVEAIADMGYIKGYDDGKFHTDDTISYQDMFVVVYRYLNDNNLLPEGNRQSTNISDHVSGIADYAKTAVNELYARSLINSAYLETASKPGIRIHIAVFLNGIRGYIENVTT